MVGDGRELRCRRSWNSAKPLEQKSRVCAYIWMNKQQILVISILAEVVLFKIDMTELVLQKNDMILFWRSKTCKNCGHMTREIVFTQQGVVQVAINVAHKKVWRPDKKQELCANLLEHDDMFPAAAEESRVKMSCAQPGAVPRKASSSHDCLQQMEHVDEIVGKAASSRDCLQQKEHVDEIVDKTASSSDCLQQRKHSEESVGSSSNVEKVFPTNDTIWEAPLQTSSCEWSTSSHLTSPHLMTVSAPLFRTIPDGGCESRCRGAAFKGLEADAFGFHSRG